MLTNLAVALLHYPVLDRRGAVVSTAITNLDIHDIARSCRTFGVGRFYVATPVTEQQVLAAQIVEHWCKGFGASYNPDRRVALELVTVVPDLEAARQHWQDITGSDPLTVLTSARGHGMSFAACRSLLATQPLLLTLGTGWGLAPELFTAERPTLEPIQGAGNYNHLPVRAALAVMLDRLNRSI